MLKWLFLLPLPHIPPPAMHTPLPHTSLPSMPPCHTCAPTMHILLATCHACCLAMHAAATHAPSPRGQTDACENITLPHTSCAGGKNVGFELYSEHMHQCFIYLTRGRGIFFNYSVAVVDPVFSRGGANS